MVFKNNTTTENNFHESTSCKYCGKSYARLKSFLKHTCKLKDRYSKKDTASIRVAYHAWLKFSNSLTRRKVPLNFDDFVKSNYFTEFEKLGNYIIEIDAIKPEQFIDFIIKKNLPSKKWYNNEVYEEYIYNLLKTEPAEDAIERAVHLFSKWAKHFDKNWMSFFREVDPDHALTWIRYGRLSPWILYNSLDYSVFVARLTDQELNILERYAPLHIWTPIFLKNKEMCNFIKESFLIDEVNI